MDDITYGAQWTAGWQRQRDKSSYVFRYTGMYGAQTRYSNLNAFGHSLTMGLSKTIHTKWTVNASATADYRTLAQFVNQPTQISAIAQLPVSFDNLAAAFSAGTFTDPQVASMLTGTPLTASPSAQGTLLLGDRILTYAAQTDLFFGRRRRPEPDGE